jgi:1-acyl-sn-glycerol-3-phosphate acyltransferase
MLRRIFITNPLAALVFLCFYLEGKLSSPQALHKVVVRWATKLLAVSGVRVQVRGSVLPSAGPFVIVSNHQSLTDTPILLSYLGLNLRFIAKRSLFDVPIIGHQLTRGGHIPVEREDARGALESLAVAEVVLREQKVSVLVFAEGTRSAGELQEFKAGAAHLAIQAGVLVLPVALSGTAALLPKGAFTIHSGDVTLSIGQPIPTTGLTKRDREAFTARIREEVAKLLADATTG